jgi:hypothetical protein
MEWPYRRFLKAYDAFQRRTLCDEWRGRKHAHIAALHANTNMDDPENDRQAQIERLEHSYDSLIARIWNGPDAGGTVKEDAAWDSPLMRAGRRALSVVQPPMMPGQAQIEGLPE